MISRWAVDEYDGVNWSERDGVLVLDGIGKATLFVLMQFPQDSYYVSIHDTCLEQKRFKMSGSETSLVHQAVS